MDELAQDNPFEQNEKTLSETEQELDSLTTEEADNLIDEWMDELAQDNPFEQNEKTLSETEQEELEFESMMMENKLPADLELEEGDDIADPRLYSFLGIKGLG